MSTRELDSSSLIGRFQPLLPLDASQNQCGVSGDMKQFLESITNTSNFALQM